MDRDSLLEQLAETEGLIVLGEQNIGISSILQPEGDEGSTVPLVLMIHKATNGQMSAALARIGALATLQTYATGPATWTQDFALPMGKSAPSRSVGPMDRCPY